MKSTTMSYDINAHIENIKCEIVTDNSNAVAVISFRNLGYGDITAVKFNAIGYNSFGDIVPIGSREKFFLIIQDILIKKNEEATNLKAKLPATDIRKLVIEEAQICFSNGSVATYEGENIKEIELQEFDNSHQEEIAAVRKLYDEKIKYTVCEFAEGWICGCGRFNQNESDICTLCGKSKIKTKNLLSSDGLKQLVEEYRSKISAEKEEARLKAIADEKSAKQKKTKTIIDVVIGIIVAIFIGNAVVMSGRTTYSSEAEMKKAVAGTYTCYDEDYDIDYQLKIEGDTVIKRWYNLGSDHDMELNVKSWNPRKGTFEISLGTIIITSEGDLKYDGNLYEHGGYWSDSLEKKTYGSSYNYNTSNGYSDLKITTDHVSSNSSYTICTGSVKNNGTKTYYYIEVKGAFKDSSGNVIDTDWTYAAGSEGLAPGESTTFRLSVTKDYDIDSCTVSLLDFD